MYVVGTLSGCEERIGAKDLAVGGDDQGVVGGEFVADLGDMGRLSQGKVVRVGKSGDRSSYCLASPAFARVWLRDHQSYLVGRGEKALQDCRREVRGACESYPQDVPSALLCQQALPPLAHGGLA